MMFLIGDESTVRKVLDANLPLSSLRNCVSLSIAQYSIDRKLGLPDSIQSLRNREGAESFFRSFPVVWRGAYTILYNWQTYILEVLQMLDSHREEVLGFAFSNSGYNCGLRDRSFVSNFELGQGDTHNKGKSVVEIELRLNDDSSTLYFKPQLFYNGALWHSVLDLVGVSDQEIARTESLRVEGRGVLEKKIVPNELVDPALVSNRLGQLTAIVYFLGGNDMHHENVVIVDDRPCLIDVETILHPSRQAEPKEGGQGDVALQLFENSVLDVGILPAGGVVDEGGKVQRFDVSVIGVSEVQRGAVKFPKLVVEESEFAVRNEWGDFVFNDPLERRGELRHQLRAFIEGFEDLYRRLLEKRDQLHDLIISSPGVAFRRITRPTAVYGKVLMESYHPDFTTSGVTQSAIHAKLFARFFSEKNRFELLSSEVSALRDFDIPHFSFALNAPEGTDSPYLAHLEKKLGAMGEADLLRQKISIVYSFATVGSRDEIGAVLQPMLSPFIPFDPPNLENFINQVVYKGDKGGLAAFDLVAPSEDVWIVAPAPFDLYSGMAGLAVAVQGIQELSGQIIAKDWAIKLGELAAEATNQFIGYSSKLESEFDQVDPSLFGPIGGLGLVRKLLAVQDENGDRNLRGYMCRVVKSCEAIDLVSGVAGALLLAIIDSYEDSMIESIATRLCDLTRARYGFDNKSGDRFPDKERLVGLSHGVSGVVLALYRLLKEVSRGQYTLRDETIDLIQTTIIDGMDWEYDLVKNHDDRWPDYRNVNTFGDSHPTFMNAWCHGSFGALVVWGEIAGENRLFLLDEDKLDYLVTSARRTSFEEITQAFGSDPTFEDDSLCHGVLGNILVVGYDIVSNPGSWGSEHIGRFRCVATSYLEAVARRFPKCGGLDSVPLIGLYMGVSGHVYGKEILSGILNVIDGRQLHWWSRASKDIFDPITLEIRKA